MPSFEFILNQVRPFDGIGIEVDVRISGTYWGAGLDEHKIELVEVPRAENGRWKTITCLHPLWRGSSLTDGIGHIVNSDETGRLIRAEIRSDMAADYLEAAA